MKIVILLVLSAAVLSSAEKSKGKRATIKLSAEDIENILRLQNNNEDANMDSAVSGSFEGKDDSSGRFFLKKLLLLSKLGGQKPQQQPIYPIIITPGVTGPTTTTTTDTVDATGTITTADARDGEIGDFIIAEDDVAEDELINGKAKKQNRIVKLKRGKGQNDDISFVVPQKYVRYFQTNNRNVGTNYNNGAQKVKIVRQNDNGNVKRKPFNNPFRRYVTHL